MPKLVSVREASKPSRILGLIEILLVFVVWAVCASKSQSTEDILCRGERSWMWFFASSELKRVATPAINVVDRTCQKYLVYPSNEFDLVNIFDILWRLRYSREVNQSLVLFGNTLTSFLQNTLIKICQVYPSPLHHVIWLVWNIWISVVISFCLPI